MDGQPLDGHRPEANGTRRAPELRHAAALLGPDVLGPQEVRVLDTDSQQCGGVVQRVDPTERVVLKWIARRSRGGYGRRRTVDKAGKIERGDHEVERQR